MFDEIQDLLPDGVSESDFDYAMDTGDFSNII